MRSGSHAWIIHLQDCMHQCQEIALRGRLLLRRHRDISGGWRREMRNDVHRRMDAATAWPKSHLPLHAPVWRYTSQHVPTVWLYIFSFGIFEVRCRSFLMSNESTINKWCKIYTYTTHTRTMEIYEVWNTHSDVLEPIFQRSELNWITSWNNLFSPQLCWTLRQMQSNMQCCTY